MQRWMVRESGGSGEHPANASRASTSRAPGAALFLSDHTGELDAAAAAGMRTICVDRGEAAIPAATRHRRVTTFAAIDPLASPARVASSRRQKTCPRRRICAVLEPMSDASSVSEPMSWGEIRERFPDQWIALVALDWADEQDRPFYTALVAGHDSRHEALDQAKPLLKLFDQLGVFFTGDPVPAAPAPAPLPPIVYVS